MAPRDYDQIEKEADLLTPEEQLRLANHLIARSKKKPARKKPVDLNKFRGILKLDEDPMEIQRRLRSEWD